MPSGDPIARSQSAHSRTPSSSIIEYPDDDLPPPLPPSRPRMTRSSSSLTSTNGSRRPSFDFRDGTKNRYLEDIRHEVMVNYLFQQQCSHLWLDHENPSECEGAILRKAKGTYLTCPPDLVDSPLANACFELNLQVSLPKLKPLAY